MIKSHYVLCIVITVTSEVAGLSLDFRQWKEQIVSFLAGNLQVCDVYAFMTPKLQIKS